MELLILSLLYGFVVSIPYIIAGTIFYSIYEVIEPFLPILIVAFLLLGISIPALILWKETKSVKKSVGAVAVVLCVYCLLISDGATRFGVLRSGHPLSAILLSSKKYVNTSVSNETGVQSLRRITKNAPVNKQGMTMDLYSIR